MNNSIKFRVWDSVLKYYVDDGYTINSKNGVIEIVPCEGRVIERFTGLPDTNNREIYEGDIVKSPINAFTREGQFVKTKAIEFRDGSFNVNRCMINYLELEVIGNIHYKAED